MKPMLLTPDLVAETMNLLRSAPHVDGLRLIADALDRKLNEPDAPSLDFLMGFATSGPSHASQVRKARRDQAYRDFWRQEYEGKSANAAAGEILKRLAQYQRERWRFDVQEGREPDWAIAPIEAVAYEFLADGKNWPKLDTIRKALVEAGKNPPSVF